AAVAAVAAPVDLAAAQVVDSEAATAAAAMVDSEAAQVVDSAVAATEAATEVDSAAAKADLAPARKTPRPSLLSYHERKKKPRALH
uniref:hypothetical protein n=1 Tax=Pseudomonas aeruginosa TaxID=287 RepID=UPI0023E30938